MTCEDYLQDPEKNAAHLESCAMCRAIALDLDDEVEIRARPLNVDALPLAGWEGASHRTWPLVAAGVIAMSILAIVLFYAAGISSLPGVANAMISAVPPVQGVVKFFQHTGQALGAPLVGVLFVIINTLLFLLLRRAPKGANV
jgi:hypothetical protein